MMVAQIIFFASLTIFIYILIQKIRRSSNSVEAPIFERQQLRQDNPSVKTGGFNPFRSLRRRRNPVKSSGIINPTPSVVDNPIVGPRPTSDFWQTEQVQDKPLVISDLDEAQKLIKAGSYVEAERLLLNAAALNPKDARIFAKLGLIYIYQKNYNDAIDSLKVAVKLDKYNPSRHYNLALAYWGIKDSQRAIAAIREAISLDPVTEKYRRFLEQLLEKK